MSLDYHSDLCEVIDYRVYQHIVTGRAWYDHSTPPPVIVLRGRGERWHIHIDSIHTHLCAQLKVHHGNRHLWARHNENDKDKKQETKQIIELLFPDCLQDNSQSSTTTVTTHALWCSLRMKNSSTNMAPVIPATIDLDEREGRNEYFIRLDTVSPAHPRNRLIPRLAVLTKRQDTSNHRPWGEREHHCWKRNLKSTEKRYDLSIITAPDDRLWTDLGTVHYQTHRILQINSSKARTVLLMMHWRRPGTHVFRPAHPKE